MVTAKLEKVSPSGACFLSDIFFVILQLIYIVLCILIFPKDVGATDKTKGSDSVSAVAIAVPVVLLILLIPVVLVAVFLYRRYDIHWCTTVRPDYEKRCP